MMHWAARGLKPDLSAANVNRTLLFWLSCKKRRCVSRGIRGGGWHIQEEDSSLQIQDKKRGEGVGRVGVRAERGLQ